MAEAVKMAVKVPYVDLGGEAKELEEPLMAAVRKVLLSGQYILGPHLAAFEKEFAEYCGSKYAIGVSNGTSALVLAFRGLGVKENDEIITAPNSFIASASSIALVGAKPVFAEVGSDMNLDPAKLERAITARTKGILPVHLTGRPAQMPEILKIAKKHNLFVIEDSAQAVGAKLDGKRTGSWGRAACFSLHPLKNLRAFGDGGMITTDDKELYEWLLQARNHGLRNRQDCDFWSTNSRLDEIQAAMLLVQLKALDGQTAKRRELAFRYNKLLKGVVGVPEEAKGEFHVYQTYMVRAERRDELRDYLNQNGVQVSVHYPTPILSQPAAKNLAYRATDFPVTMDIVSKILSLPLFPSMTQKQQDTVVELIKDFYAR